MITLKRTLIACAALLLVAGCTPEENVGGDTFVDEQDTGAEADTAEDTGSEEPDTQMPEDTDEEPDDAGDTAGDTGEPTDTEPTDTGVPTDTPGDTTPPMDTTDTTPPDTVGDTGMELDRDALPSQFGPGSFVNKIYIDQQTPDPQNRCCFDIDGTPGNDNAVADLLRDLSSLTNLDVATANMNTNSLIQQGQLIFLFEYGMWDGAMWQNDGSIDMMALNGQDAMAPFSDNLAGTGGFLTDPSSYASNGQPKSQFQSASTSSGKLTASGGTITLPIDFGQGINMDLNINNAELTANVSTSASVQPGGTVPLTQGKIGGAIPKGDIYEGINRAASQCQCYDMGQNKLIQPATPTSIETYTCRTNNSGCSCSGQIAVVESACSLFILDDIKDAADINLKSAKPEPDALSFGATFEAVGAKITGVAP